MDALESLISEISKKPSNKKDDDLPVDERTISIPKKYLKGFKEGGIIELQVLLEDGDNLILLPKELKTQTPEEEEKDDEEVIKKIKEEREGKKPGETKKEKKDVKDILSEEMDKTDKESKE
jgi:hypothetical protein